MLGSLCTTQILKLKPFAHCVLYLLFPYYGTKKVLDPLSRRWKGKPNQKFLNHIIYIMQSKNKLTLIEIF